MATDGLQARVEGLAEFRSALRVLGGEWNRALGKIHREVSKRVAMHARSTASRWGRQQARSAGAIRWSGTATAARVRTVQNARYPFANPAFWGRIKRTGWYARIWAMSHTGRAQSLPWVGSDWRVGIRGEGPYVINDAVADELPGIMGDYSRRLDELFNRAFPN